MTMNPLFGQPFPGARVGAGRGWAGPTPAGRGNLGDVREDERSFTSEYETSVLAADLAAQEEIAEAEVAYAAGDFMSGEELRARFGLPPVGG